MSTLMNDFDETFVLAFYNSFLKIKIKLIIMVAYLQQNSAIEFHLLNTLIQIHSKTGYLIFSNNIVLF